MIFLALCAFTAAAHMASAQPPANAPRVVESVSLEIDAAAIKKLGAAQDFIAAGQWNDAVELLRQIGDEHSDRIVPLVPGRYVSVPGYCDLLLSALPAEGLRLYRTRVDPQARDWFEAGRKQRDPELLQRVVDGAFASSFGDDALFLLGELAWERGDLAAARGFWRRLLPASRRESASPPPVLHYPDAAIDLALVRARLVLCSILQGHASQASWELRQFSELHPESRGNLTGRSGNLVEILRETILHSGGPLARQPDESRKFAVTPARTGVVAHGVEPAHILWEVPLRSEPSETAVPEHLDWRSAVPVGGNLACHPVTARGLVLAADDISISAWELATGKPAWSSRTEKFTDPRVARERAVIYRLPSETGTGAPLRATVGLPEFTLTIDEGRVYARLGSVRFSRFDGQGPRPSFLVGLDLTKEGKPLFDPISSEQIPTDRGTWMFEGAPVVSDAKLFVALRRQTPQPQANVACFDVETGKLVWNRKICVSTAAASDETIEFSQQLLTLAGNRSYYNTNLGAVASLNSRDGAIRWVTTYPHVEAESVRAANRRQVTGPNPGVYHDGTLFVAPTDGDEYLALDADTGIIRWTTPIHGHSRALLGIGQERLIVSGDQLSGLDLDTGETVWSVGTIDPEGFGYGRGMLAGDRVYWPTRDEIYIVHQASGAIERRVSLWEQYGETGGNLLIAPGKLVIAGPAKLVVLGE